MAWSSFTNNMKDIFKYDASLDIDTDVLRQLINQAQDQVEDDLRQIVYEKFDDAGYDLTSDDIPDEPLDIILSGAYAQIRKKIVFYTLMLVYLDEAEKYAMWQKRYDNQSIGDVYFNLDVDQSGDISLSDGVKTKKDLQRIDII